MDKDERKPHALEDRLEAYAAWVGDLRRGHSPSHLPEDTAAPLDKLNHELRLLADVITRREDQLNKLFEVVHTVERGILVEDVLDDFITPAHAREAYGVVLKSADDGFAWALDEAATEKLRSSMRG